MARLVSQEGCRSTQLFTGWVCRSAPAGAASAPPPADEPGAWFPALVPGTVATARAAAGLPEDDDGHARDHWYRLDGALPGGAAVEFAGLATRAEIWLDGMLTATSDTMFVPLTVPLPPEGVQRLEICFRALRPLLRQRRPGPRARWRNRLAAEENLRDHRTTLLGHMPGWSGNTPVIGPFRPVTLHEPIAGAPHVTRADLRASVLSDGTGLISARLEGVGLAAHPGSLAAGEHRVTLQPQDGALLAELRIPAPSLWWPHTHGDPATYAVTAEIGGFRIDLGRIGFRTITRRDPAAGLGLIVNGAPVFCRGAIWAGLDATAAPADPARLRASLELARRAGVNMLRVTGMTLYETPEFFAHCDDLGIMVWHDFMFARFDYSSDPAFQANVEAEARTFLDATQANASLAVLCGGTEIMQAAAMAGCPEPSWRMPLFDEVLAREAAALRPDVPYVPHSPWPGPGAEGSLPFAASAAVTHYFGVGAYQRPLHELASAGVRFAAECLAFANLPDGTSRAIEACRDVVRDAGATWDFGDVRDHYLEQLFAVSAPSLRRRDPEAWIALGRAAVAIVMQRAIGTWRTDGTCAGALVLMWQDVVPGAGWGVVDSDGRPKSAWHALRGVCQPIQVILRDLGHDGVFVHSINETAESRHVRLTLRGLSPDGSVESLGSTVFELPARTTQTLPAMKLLGRWRDLTNAWQFGPPAFDVLGAALDDAETGRRLSDDVHFPTGPALPPAHPKLTARLAHDAGEWSVHVSAEGFAQFVEVEDDDCVPADNYFHLWPGESRNVALRRSGQCNDAPSGTVRALNAHLGVHYGMAA